MSIIEALWVSNYNQNKQLGNFNKSNVRTVRTLIKSNLLFKKPVVLVGAGPSLDRNISILKENQDKFIILCVDVVLYKLVKEGIRPDFVCIIDPNSAVTRFWSYIDTTGLKLVAPTTVSPEAIKLWKGDIFLFTQYDTSSKEKQELLLKLNKSTHDYGLIANMFFVGATLLQVATIFKPDFIFLLGYDFGFTDGKTHCNGILTMDLTEPIEKKELKYDSEVNGIKTSNLLSLYKTTFLGLVRDLEKRSTTKVVNCTEGGILTELPNDTLSRVASFYEPLINKTQLGGPKKRKRKK